MGLFQQRPEEPSEWAGLPAEPWEPRGPAELLADPVSASSSTIDVPLFGDLPARTTIAISGADPHDAGAPGEASSGADEAD